MVSYEVSIGFVIITVLLCAGSLNLSAVVEAQNTKFGLLGWYWLPLFPMFVIFYVSALAETNRPPFDLVEAESELVAGFMPGWLAPLPTVMMALGLLIAYIFYIRRPYLPVELANQHQMLYQFLLNKWYFDELYDFIFVRPAKRIGYFLWKKGDGYIIDGFGPDGVSARVLDVTRNVVKVQTGYLYHYAFAMLIGVAGLITWFMFGLGGQ